MSSDTPTTNIAAEESVLGALMLSPSALETVIDEVGLVSTDFYLERHRMIYGAIRDLHLADKPVDELSVTAALEKRGGVDLAGGDQYVAELVAKVPAVGNARHYAEIVQGCALKRPSAASDEDRPAEGSITELFEAAFYELTQAHDALGRVDGLTGLPVEEAAQRISEADRLLGRIRTRLHGCWLPEAQAKPFLLPQIGQLIPSTCKTTVDLALTRTAFSAGGPTPKATVVVDTTGMSSDEIEAANASARDMAEDLATLFTPTVKVSGGES